MAKAKTSITTENRSGLAADVAAKEQRTEMPLSDLHPFEGHPFKVLDDELMEQTVESIKQIGVVSPLIVRPDPEGGFEILSGHRRLHAAQLAGLETVPVIVKEMDDDAAIIFMVDSNLQRENILPSERAFSYKMKLDAMKHQGTRNDLETTSRQVVGKLEAADTIGEQTGESGRQVQRFIRLTNLIPEILDMVDEKKIAFNPAVELSYLKPSEQKEFLEAIAGLQAIESGSITLLDDNGKGTELAGMDSISINKAGISLAFVPEDRIGMGLVGDMDMTDNMMLRSYRNGKSPFLDRKGPKALALKIKEQLEVMTPSISAPVRQMSGGNVQKVLVGREIAQNPKVLLVAFPTRGVDVNTSHVIYRLLNEQKKKGVAVVCVIEDLDVVLELCDRIAVFCGGKISGIEDGRTATKEEIGLLMTKHEKGGTQA